MRKAAIIPGVNLPSHCSLCSRCVPASPAGRAGSSCEIRWQSGVLLSLRQTRAQTPKNLAWWETVKPLSMYLFYVAVLIWQSPSHTDATNAGIVPAVFRCCSRVHPPAGSSPGVKFEPNPVQLLFELCLVCRWEMLLDQVFMCYLPTNKSSDDV